MRGNDALSISESRVSDSGENRGETARDNGRNNSGDSGTSGSGTSGTTSTSNRTGSASGTGSGGVDRASGRIDNANAGNTDSGRTGAESIGSSTEDGGRLEELTDDTTTTRTRTRTSGGSGARSGRTRTSGRANQEKDSLAEDLDGVKPPRKVKGVVVDDTFTVSESAKELIGDLYMVMFWIAAQVTSTPEMKLGDDEGELLGDKTEKFVKSLGKRRATNVMKSLGKIGPAVGLVSAVAMVTVPRAKLLMGKKKSGGLPRNAEQRQTAATTEATTDRVATENPPDIRPGGDANTGLRERSFTFGDFEEISPGYAQQNT